MPLRSAGFTGEEGPGIEASYGDVHPGQRSVVVGGRLSPYLWRRRPAVAGVREEAVASYAGSRRPLIRSFFLPLPSPRRTSSSEPPRPPRLRSGSYRSPRVGATETLSVRSAGPPRWCPFPGGNPSLHRGPARARRSHPPPRRTPRTTRMGEILWGVGGGSSFVTPHRRETSGTDHVKRVDILP